MMNCSARDPPRQTPTGAGSDPAPAITTNPTESTEPQSRARIILLTYNGINLDFCLTQSIEQVVERDDSGTDANYTLYRFSCQAVVTAPEGEDLTRAAKKLEHDLNQDRKPLKYTGPDGVTYLELPDGRDAATGPKVLACSVTMVSAGSWLVNFSVECRTADCPGQQPRPVLSLRWTESTSYDRLWRCTKRRAGTIVVAAGSTPDAYRGLVTPLIPQGFARESASYDLDKTGLACNFSFEDRELVKSPVLPALRMRGRMSETIPMPGAVRHGEISLRLEGPKGMPTQDLMRAAIAACMARAKLAGVASRDGRPDQFLMGGAISESLNDDENAVEVSLRWQVKATSARTTGDLKLTSAGRAVKAVLNPFGAAAAAIRLLTEGQKLDEAQRPATGKKAAVGGTFGSWVGGDLLGSLDNRAVGMPTRGTAEHVGLYAALLGDPCGRTFLNTAAPAPSVGVAELSTGNRLPERAGGGAELTAGGSRLPEKVGTSLGGSVTVDVSGPAIASGAQLTARTLAALDVAEPDDTEAAYDDKSPGVYDCYHCVSHYVDDPGVAVLPATHPDGVAKVTRMHGGLTTLKAQWSVSRTGGLPVIPSTDSGDLNIVYVKGVVSPEMTELAPDGVTGRFTVSGSYEFAVLDRKKFRTVAPLAPYLSGTVAAKARLAAALVSTRILFDPPGSGGPNTLVNTGLYDADGGDFDTSTELSSTTLPPRDAGEATLTGGGGLPSSTGGGSPGSRF